DVLLEQSKIKAASGNILDLADVPGVDDLFHAPYGGRKQEGMAHHQNETLTIGEADEFLSFLHSSGDGVLDEHLFSRTERGFSHVVVKADRRGDHQGIERIIFKQILETPRGGDLRIKPRKMIQARLIDVAQYLELTVWCLVQVAHQVRSPITAPNYPNLNVLLHFLLMAN